MTFGEAVYLDEFFANQNFDGIWGLGFKEIAEGGVTPPFDRMLEEKVVDAPIFGVWLGGLFLPKLMHRRQEGRGRRNHIWWDQ